VAVAVAAATVLALQKSLCATQLKDKGKREATQLHNLKPTGCPCFLPLSFQLNYQVKN
jgi:hypothetical protein